METQRLAFNENDWYTLQFCCSDGLCITNPFFPARSCHKYTRYRPSMAQKSLIDFCIASSDLFSEVLEVRRKLIIILLLALHEFKNLGPTGNRVGPVWLTVSIRRLWRTTISGNSLHQTWHQSSDNLHKFLKISIKINGFRKCSIDKV